jgi:hypothetical protein
MSQKAKLIMQKKYLIVAALVVLVIGSIIFAAIRWLGKSNTPAEDGPVKKKIVQSVNIIPVAERPYIFLEPQADGRNIRLVAVELKKSAEVMEYELEYQAGSLLQGAFGALELNSFPANQKILFGSCSAGGACTYHEDVKGGTLLTRYDGPDPYALKSDWKYIDNRTRETEISSKDALFQLSSPELAKHRYLVIFNAPGYPTGLEGTPVSDPYSLQSSSRLTGSLELTMRAREEGELVIMGWDGSKWHEFTGEVDGRMITAEVEMMELYIVVQK